MDSEIDLPEVAIMIGIKMTEEVAMEMTEEVAMEMTEEVATLKKEEAATETTEEVATVKKEEVAEVATIEMNSTPADPLDTDEYRLNINEACSIRTCCFCDEGCVRDSSS